MNISREPTTSYVWRDSTSSQFVTSFMKFLEMELYLYGNMIFHIYPLVNRYKFNFFIYKLACTFAELLKTDCVWLNMKSQLLKSRRKFFPCNLKSRRRIHIEEAFPEGDDDDSNGIKKEIFEYEFQENFIDETPSRMEPPITFRFHSFTPTTGRLRFLNQARPQATSQITANYVIIGKRTLLAPELTNIKNSINNHSKCINHSIMYHNL